MSNDKVSTGNERLPEQQCPVQVAKNDLIAEQIERDAITYVDVEEMAKEYHAHAKSDYSKGATAQDKIATNRTVEEAIKILNLYAWMLDTNEDRDTLIKELEKMRR